jgi:hypothetical protein
MPKREPLYPHVPKSRRPIYSHKSEKPSYLKETKPFIKVGDRVRYIGKIKGRSDTWPEGVWLEKGIEGTVTEYQPRIPAPPIPGEEPIEAYAVVKFDNGASSAIDSKDEGERWERVKSSYLKERIDKYSTGTVQVYFVDGSYVRDNIDLNFTQGGHHYVYDWIPDTEIWLDSSNRNEYQFILLHELRERNRMLGGLSYYFAHDDANTIEQQARNKPETVHSLILQELTGR